jgi:hypothetical protein
MKGDFVWTEQRYLTLAVSDDLLLLLCDVAHAEGLAAENPNGHNTES